MNVKKILGVVGLLVAGYKIGKISGEIKMIKIGLDLADEVMPGVKRSIAESISDSIIKAMFDDKPNEKGS